MSIRGRLLNTLFLLAAALISLNSCLAQISGVLTAPNGKPEAGAEVFINRSSFRSVTDDFGHFNLLDVPAGFHEIVAYKKGFTLYRAPMRVQAGKGYELNLAFAATEKKARGKSTPETKTAFETAFLGTEGLLLYHPDTRVEVEAADGKFRVFSGPVVVDYPNAGYRVTAYFTPTIFQNVSEAAYCYQEYQGTNVNQNMAVERARMEIYTGSLRHWLTAVVNGTSRKEGFMEYDAAGNQLPNAPIASASASPGYSRIILEQPIEVRFEEKEKTKLSATSPIDVNRSGWMINGKSLNVEGAMNSPGLARQLPLDYKPIDDIEGTYAEALRFFYEKVYLHTDKPYYYPGEPLWFKAYINYYNLSWRDSLSDVLYVELVSSKDKLELERMYRITDGLSMGDFILPDSLPEGTYYLRAYTNVRLNFGAKNLFTKPIRVLAPTDKVDGSALKPTPEHESLTIIPNQETYAVREKVTLELNLGAAIENGASLSISVTDAAQVIPIPEPMTILNSYLIDKSEIPVITELTQRIERGVSFYGQFVNNKGDPEKTNLTFIQWKTGDVLNAETGDDGKFWQTGLQFSDSARFSYKSDKAKGRPYGKVIVLPRDRPPLEAVAAPDFAVVQAGAVQRIFSEYEVPKDSKMLEEIEVRGQRAEDSEFERAKRRPYGRADRVLTSKQLNVNSGNILFALVGKVPGLLVNPTLGTVYFSRAVGNSIILPASPLVTVNDQPMAGEAGMVLQSLDFNMIESIEFTGRLNSLYGAQGANGVIAVYMKSGAGVDTKDPNFQTIKMAGFSPLREFKAPSYEQPKQQGGPGDYRSTIYWNPDVRPNPSNGTATVSFYASDLAGLYRVVVEGVGANGKPVRAVHYLNIVEK